MVASEAEQYTDYEDGTFCFPSDDMFRKAIMSLKDGRAVGPTQCQARSLNAVA